MCSWLSTFVRTETDNDDHDDNDAYAKTEMAYDITHGVLHFVSVRFFGVVCFVSHEIDCNATAHCGHLNT